MTQIDSGKKLYEGKAKILFAGPEPDTIIQYFKDTATAFNNQKKAEMTGKGILNNAISFFLMEYLQKHGVSTHLIRKLNEREQLVHQVAILPLEVVVRNIAAGSICTRMGLTEGASFPQPVIEFFYKDDALGDPLVAEGYITANGLASPEDITIITTLALQVNTLLSALFASVNIILVDFKLEFGRLSSGTWVLADEISPDSCRLWEQDTKQKLDKDIFRRELGDLLAGYREVAKRLGLS